MSAPARTMDENRILINSFSEKYNDLQENFGNFSLEDAKKAAGDSLEHISKYLGGKAKGAYEVVDNMNFEDLEEGVLGQYIHGVPGIEEIDLSEESEDQPEGLITTIHEMYHAAKDYAGRGIGRVFNSVRNYLEDESETEKGTIKIISDMAADGDEKAEVAAFKYLRDSAILEELYEEIVESNRDILEVKEDLYDNLDGISREEYDEIFDIFLKSDKEVLEEYTVEPYREVLESLELGKDSLELVGEDQEASNLFDMIGEAVKTYSERIESFGSGIYDYVMGSDAMGAELEPAQA